MPHLVRPRGPATALALVAVLVLAAAPVDARPLRQDERERRDAQPPTTVIARLLDTGPTNAPHCGTLHVGVVMRYEVLQVIGARPSFGPRGNIWRVIHGCPELTRARYQHSAGDATSFRVGDVHRLLLTLRRPEQAPDSIIQSPTPGRSTAMWALRADRASAP